MVQFMFGLNNNSIQPEDSASRIYLRPKVASVAVGSKVVIMLLFQMCVCRAFVSDLHFVV